MAEDDFVTRYSLLLFVVLGALGVAGLAVAHGKIEGPNFNGLVHLSAMLVLLSGVALMWRAENKG